MDEQLQVSKQSQKQFKLPQEELKEQAKFDSQIMAISEEKKQALKNMEDMVKNVSLTAAYVPKGGFLSLDSEQLSFSVTESKVISKEDILSAKRHNRKALKQKAEENLQGQMPEEEGEMTLDEAMTYLLQLVSLDLSTDKAVIEEYESLVEMERANKRMERFETVFEHHPEIDSIYRERYHVLKSIVSYAKTRIDLILDEAYEGMTNHELQELKQKPQDEKAALREKLLLCESRENALRKEMDNEEGENEVALKFRKAGQEGGADLAQAKNQMPDPYASSDMKMEGFPGYGNLDQVNNFDQFENKIPFSKDESELKMGGFPEFGKFDQKIDFAQQENKIPFINDEVEAINKIPDIDADFAEEEKKLPNADDDYAQEEKKIADDDDEEYAMFYNEEEERLYREQQQLQQQQGNALNQSFMYEEREIPDMTGDIPAVDETTYVSEEELERLKKEIEEEKEEEEEQEPEEKNEEEEQKEEEEKQKPEEKQEPESLLKKNQEKEIELHLNESGAVLRAPVDLEKQKQEAKNDLDKLDAFLKEKGEEKEKGGEGSFPEAIPELQEKMNPVAAGYEEISDDQLAAFDQMLEQNADYAGMAEAEGNLQVETDRKEELSRLDKEKKKRERERAYLERDTYQELLENRIPNHTDGEEIVAVKTAVWQLKLALRGEAYIGNNFNADYLRLQGLQENDQRRSERITKHIYKKEEILILYNKLISRCDNYIVQRGGMRRTQGQVRLNLIKEIKKKALSELGKLRPRLEEVNVDSSETAIPDLLLEVRKGQELKEKLPDAIERKLKNSRTKAKDLGEYLAAFSILEKENPGRFKPIAGGIDSPVEKMIDRMVDRKFLTDAAKQMNECMALLADKFRVLMNQNVPDRYLKENGQDPSDPVMRRQYALARIRNDHLFYQIAGIGKMTSYLSEEDQRSFQKMLDDGLGGLSVEMKALIRDGRALLNEDAPLDQLNEKALLLLKMKGENEEKKFLRNAFKENDEEQNDLFEIRSEKELKHLHFVQTDPVYLERIKNGKSVEYYEGYICSPTYKYKPQSGYHGRMAGLLGFGNLLGKAYAQEEAIPIPPLKLSAALQEGAKWSPEALKERAALSALNFLFGNTEMDPEQYECEGDNGVITHVRLAPDTVINFRAASTDSLMKAFTKSNNMLPMLRLDDSVKQKLLEMGPITLASQFGQFLSKPQMDALGARLKTLQDYFINAEKSAVERRKLAKDKVKKYRDKKDKDQDWIIQENRAKMNMTQQLNVVQESMRREWNASMRTIDDVENSFNALESELSEKVWIAYRDMQALSMSEDMKKLKNKKDPGAYIVFNEYKEAVRRAEAEYQDRLTRFFTALNACESDAAVREVLARQKSVQAQGFEVL